MPGDEITDVDEMLEELSKRGGLIVRKAAEVIGSHGLTGRPPNVLRAGKPQEHYVAWRKGGQGAAVCRLTTGYVAFQRRGDQPKLAAMLGTERRGGRRDTVIRLAAPGALQDIARALDAVS